MKRLLACAWVAAALPVAVTAQGPGWPVKPVRVIVPFTAGSPVEIPARPVTQRLAETPEIRRHYADNGLVPVGNTPEQFAEFLRKDIALQAEIAKRIGLQPQ